MNLFSDAHLSPGTSSTGLDAKLVGLLCYALFWVTGFIFILLEKNSRFVKFHALQSIFVFGGLSLLSVMISIFSFILGWMALFAWLMWAVVMPLVWIAVFILWVVLMVKALQGESWMLPVVGELALRYA